MSLKTLYTSIACNRTPESLDWGPDGLIYFAANHVIAVFNPQFHGSVKIVRTLFGHKARINAVCVIRNANDCHGGIHLASGSDDGTCILWNTARIAHTQSSSPPRFTLSGHGGGVTSVDAFVDASNNLIVATGSVDSTIRLWHAAGNEFVCSQTIDLRTGLTFGLKLFTLVGSNATMLAYTTDTDMVNLCVSQPDVAQPESGNKFVQVEQLRGHVDWVRGLTCTRLPESDDYLLASSSQDTFVRLWRISPRKTLTAQKPIEEIQFDEDITLEERTFTVVGKDGGKYHYALSLESVLQGHEGWVYGVNFCMRDNQLQLLSSSIDKSLIVWTPSESGVWMESVRVGEVGGSSLGFYGGKFSPDGRSIIGHGFQGSFHLWHEDTEQPGLWKPGIIIGGHFGGVRDLSWDPTGGMFLMTVSTDQTTRIHAPWRRAAADQIETWHEIGRPQVHGYDMQCLTLLSRYRLASAAEEKIIRVFQTPSNFVQNFRALCRVTEDPEGDSIFKGHPMGASVPSLGLSNKAVYEVEQPEADSRHIKDMYPEHYFNPVSMDAPPTEETLMQNTLWPEIQKLYGHGNELYSIAASSDGSLIASACRATSSDHAQILLWDTQTWRIVQQLAAHQLTVTQLSFAPNNRLLLAVSRDRTFSVYEREQDAGDFKQLMRSDKTNGVHTRIIWCCDWSHDSETFVTGSRDGKAVAWSRQHAEGTGGRGCFSSNRVLELKNESITALAFGRKKLSDERYLVAVGLEKGIIKLYALGQWNLLLNIDQSYAHHQTVQRLSFRPHVDDHQLASCGDDGLVRVYSIEV